MIKNPHRLGHCSSVVRLNNKLSSVSFYSYYAVSTVTDLDVNHALRLFLWFELSNSHKPDF